MNIPSFSRYEADALEAGFDEVLVRVWAPNAAVDIHQHAFGVEALVVAGDMWLTSGDVTRHLRAGDAFALEPFAPHSERYGPTGATYWAARKNAR